MVSTSVDRRLGSWDLSWEKDGYGNSLVSYVLVQSRRGQMCLARNLTYGKVRCSAELTVVLVRSCGLDAGSESTDGRVSTGALQAGARAGKGGSTGLERALWVGSLSDG